MPCETNNENFPLTFRQRTVRLGGVGNHPSSPLRKNPLKIGPTNGGGGGVNPSSQPDRSFPFFLCLPLHGYIHHIRDILQLCEAMHEKCTLRSDLVTRFATIEKLQLGQRFASLGLLVRCQSFKNERKYENI